MVMLALTFGNTTNPDALVGCKRIDIKYSGAFNTLKLGLILAESCTFGEIKLFSTMFGKSSIYRPFLETRF